VERKLPTKAQRKGRATTEGKTTTRRRCKGVEGYEQLGDPDAPWTGPTKRDERRQQQIDDIKKAAHEMVARDVAEGRGPSDKAIEETWRMIESWPKPMPHELMVWRFRLLCGHIHDATAHASHKTIHGARTGTSTTCPECGREFVIVAAKAIGLAGRPPKPPKAYREQERERVEREIARHDREAAKLRQRLAEL
jgi:hypothetical protein